MAGIGGNRGEMLLSEGGFSGGPKANVKERTERRARPVLRKKVEEQLETHGRLRAGIGDENIVTRPRWITPQTRSIRNFV